MGKENMKYTQNGVLHINQNEIAEKWMELEIFMLSKISQTQKDKYQIFFSYAESRFF
jgi:hypothetical protein